jgi:hypothetical protein
MNLTKYGNIKTVVKHICLQLETWGLLLNVQELSDCKKKSIECWIICGVHVIFTFVAHSGWSHVSVWAAPYKYEWIAIYA